MNEFNDKILNIGFIGGGDLCRETLIKAYRHYSTDYIPGRIAAVADEDYNASGMILARQLGIFTTTDFRDLYDPELALDQIHFYTPDESIYWEVLDTRPRHIRLVAFPGLKLFHDMLRYEERRLQAQRDELTAIINDIRDGIAVIDRNFKIIKANKTLLDNMGYTEGEVVGRFCYEVFHLSDHPCRAPYHPCPLQEARELNKPVHAIHIHTTLEGEERIIDLTIHPTMSPSGEVNRFVEITRDITERYRVQEEITQRLEKAVEERTEQLEMTHRKLIQQDKMTSLGKLSASVVHELNNPLTGILTFNRLIQRIISEKSLTPDTIKEIEDHLQLMEKETHRCSKIVSNLLAFARQSKMEPEEANLNQIIEQVLTLNAHNLALNNIKVLTDLDQTIPLVFGDVDQLQQVFMNLIFNAVDSMEENERKRLILTTGYDRIEDMIMVRIRDSGSGISEEHLPEIFEPFYTTKPAGQGLGLGLSVVFGVVKEHRGQIDVDRTGPEGTTFLIRLPAYRPEERAEDRS